MREKPCNVEGFMVAMPNTSGQHHALQWSLHASSFFIIAVNKSMRSVYRWKFKHRRAAQQTK